MTAPKTMYVRGNPNGAMGRWHDATPLEETAAIASDGPNPMFRYVLADPAALAGDELVLAMIGAVVDPHEKSYIDLHTKAFAVLQWFETARPDLIGPRIEALKAAIYGPRPYGEARPDATAALARALRAERVKALREGYLAGFKASGEGWNGEYPFEGEDPEKDAHWIEKRDRALKEVLG